MSFLRVSIFLLLIAGLSGCQEMPLQAGIETTAPEPAPKPFPLSKAFRTYWYGGQGELTSFSLKQARYGELRDGHAVLIYVTEPFDPQKQVKDDRKDEESVSVLKLNRTKKFLTGIYPYSVMTSVFHPVGDHTGALKVSTSVQEWCGHTYTQLNQRDSLEIMGHSYFESEADQLVTLPKTLTEDEIWNKIRVAPERLPQGEVSVVPSLEYLRLKHQPFKDYTAQLSLSEPGPVRTFTLRYPELNRSLEIRFEGSFPHRILGWSETYPEGFGANSEVLSTVAERVKTIQTPYWRQNSNADSVLRESLGL